MIWEEFLGTFTDETYQQVIKDYEEFESVGVLGVSVLRSKAQEWRSSVFNHVSIVAVMDDIALEAYRHFAKKYLLAHSGGEE
jgi:hypothetical protein